MNEATRICKNFIGTNMDSFALALLHEQISQTRREAYEEGFKEGMEKGSKRVDPPTHFLGIPINQWIDLRFQLESHRTNDKETLTEIFTHTSNYGVKP